MIWAIGGTGGWCCQVGKNVTWVRKDSTSQRAQQPKEAIYGHVSTDSSQLGDAKNPESREHRLFPIG